MRGGLLMTIVVLAVTAGAASATAGSGPAATGGSRLTVHDVFGLNTLELQDFGFNARVTSDGSADGWFTYRDVEDGAPFTASGPITCLTVIGNQAWVGATIDRSNDPTIVGMGAWWHVTDNGQGAGSQPDITTFLGVGTLDATAAFCAGHPAYLHPFAIDAGNIQVRQ
jgi:hypothetical protein